LYTHAFHLHPRRWLHGFHPNQHMLLQWRLRESVMPVVMCPDKKVPAPEPDSVALPISEMFPAFNNQSGVRPPLPSRCCIGVGIGCHPAPASIPPNIPHP